MCVCVCLQGVTSADELIPTVNYCGLIDYSIIIIILAHIHSHTDRNKGTRAHTLTQTHFGKLCNTVAGLRRESHMT